MFKWLKERRDRRKHEREVAVKAHLERHFYRLRNPDFDALVRCFGADISPELKRLYSNHAEVICENITRYTCDNPREDDTIFVGYYIPADQESLDDRWPDNNAFFEFADDGLGNRYVVDPVVADPSILFYDHEEHWHKRTGMTLSQYLATSPADV